MKVKHVLKDLGPKTQVQIYIPSDNGYKQCFFRPYTMESILDVRYISIFGQYFNEDIDHVEYGHHYTTDDMVASCNIYLKAKYATNEEKPSTGAIDYTDLKKKWGRFCKEYCVEGADTIQAWHINVFLDLLSNGELIEMEDKDLS